MKNKLITFVGGVAVALALTQTVQAVPITGNIGFSGGVQLNSLSVQTATAALSWLNPEVNGSSGSFAGIANSTPVTLANGWSLDSGVLNGFWSIAGFTFRLTSSSISSQNALFLNVILAGTVSGNGFDTTSFGGTFQVANPAANGVSLFTSRLSFNALNTVPDGGSTALLLAMAFAGLVLLRRKTIQASVMA
jgi:hypothetical protein